MTDAAGQVRAASWRRMLAARPLHNAAAEVTAGADELRIAVRTKRPRWMVPPPSWIVPLRPTRTVRLDRVGSRVWHLCDGERTVEQVVEEFARGYNLTFHEARVAVTGYLRQLVQRGALAVEMPTEGGPR